MKVAVSYLDSVNLKETIKKINNSIADYIHLDLMDGKYVESDNINIENINLLKETTKPIDIHLMVNDPLKYLDYFSNLNVDRITVHPRTVTNFPLLREKVNERNIKLGIAINPNETVDELKDYFSLVDSILVMSVNPGKGGQTFIDDVLSKIAQIKTINSKLIIGFDGGINSETVKKLHDVDYVVSGSYIYHSSDYNEAIKSLK